MAINIKLSSVETAEFTPLSEGWYDAVIHDIRMRETGPASKNPGEPQLAVTFRVTEEGDSKNRRLFAYYTLVPDSEDHKGMVFTKRFLNGIGVDVDADVDFEPRDHINQAVEVRVELQEWNGSMSNRVTEVQSAALALLA